MAFSREATKQEAILIKIEYRKTQARAQHPDMKTKHPDWCRDASKGNYTMLVKLTTEEVEKKQKRNETFQRKLHQDG